MWLGCAGPGPGAYDGYSAGPKPVPLSSGQKRYGFEPPRASSPMPQRSPLGDAVADGRLRRGAHEDPFQAFDHTLEENRWMAHEMNEAPQWSRPWQAESHRLRQEIFDLQIAEHGAALRAQLHEQQVWAEARAMEHQASMQASQNYQKVEQQAALQLQQAVQHEAAKASDIERRYAARLAATSSEAAAAQADAASRRAEGPRLEAQAAAHAQRMINAKVLEADRRTSEAVAARECVERLVNKQLSELKDSSAANGELAAERDAARQRLQNTEEVNARLSRRLRNAEEANQELIARLRDSEEARNQLIASLRGSDPALAAQLTGEALDPEAPQRTAAAMEGENLELRANLLEVTEQLEQMSEQHQEVSMRLHSARSKSPPQQRGVSPRGISPRGVSPRGGSPRAKDNWARAKVAIRPNMPGFNARAASPRNSNSARRESARSAGSSMGFPTARSSAGSSSGGVAGVGGNRSAGNSLNIPVDGQGRNAAR